MDHAKVRESIFGTLVRAGAAASDQQQLLLTGMLAVWIEKAYEEGRLSATPALRAIDGAAIGIRYLGSDLARQTDCERCKTRDTANLKYGEMKTLPEMYDELRKLCDDHLQGQLSRDDTINRLLAENKKLKQATGDEPPDGSEGHAACPFCGGAVDPQGWLNGMDERGPECSKCGATAPSLAVWDKRHVQLTGEIRDNGYKNMYESAADALAAVADALEIKEQGEITPDDLLEAIDALSAKAKQAEIDGYKLGYRRAIGDAADICEGQKYMTLRPKEIMQMYSEDLMNVRREHARDIAAIIRRMEKATHLKNMADDIADAEQKGSAQ